MRLYRSRQSLAHACRVALVACAVATGIAVCSGTATAQKRSKPKPVTASDTTRLLRQVKSWTYQPSGSLPSVGPRTSSDLLVLDAGSVQPGDQISRTEMGRLKRTQSGGRRLVLARLSIGEAEEGRGYWNRIWTNAPPSWLAAKDCRVAGSYAVRFWMPEWQSIVYGPRSQVAKLIAAGFDGVLLDHVDAFQTWRRERWQAASDMAEFVASISRWAKARNPAFLVLPINGEELLSGDRLLKSIDGVGKTDLIYGDRGDDTPNIEASIERSRRNLALATAAGLPVFVVEHPQSPENATAARARLEQLGYVPYIGPRSPRATEEGCK